jgi:hypothetical protein
MKGAVSVLNWSSSLNSHMPTEQVGAGVTLTVSDPKPLGSVSTLAIFALELQFRTKVYNEITSIS